MGQYSRVHFHGKPITKRQKVALRQVERVIGREFTCYQGSWQPPSDVSGTTHTRAGVCDLWLPNMGDNDETRHVTRMLRRVGHQASYLRGPTPEFGGYVWHWHTVDLDTTGMDINAIWQVGQYRDGFDGLTAGHPDPVKYRPDPINAFNYELWRKQQPLRARLAEIIHDAKALPKRRREARARLDGLYDH